MDPLDDSILDEFIVDSLEGLNQFDRDLLELEQDPSSRDALGSAFRALHSIKGTCSFLGLGRLERVSHAGEHILSRLRSGQLALTPDVSEALLAIVDAVRRLLAGIEQLRHEPAGDDEALFARIATWLPARDRADGPPNGPTATVPGPAAAPDAASALEQQHLRVDVRRLDEMMDLVGELVLARNQLVQTLAAATGTAAGAAAQRINHVTTQLQDAVMGTRMQSVSALWSRLPRLTRDVAAACGKSVRLEMEGTATRLDRTLVEALKEPLTHLIRNAIDHGIETPQRRVEAGKPPQGVIRLRAFEEGGNVHLLLEDDGAGMAVQRIREQALARGLVDPASSGTWSESAWLQLVFQPGFSTAAEVTNISGRGVGLDVARTAVARVGGTIEVSTTSGAGTLFHVRLPLTLAIVPALTVEQSGECYVLPQAHLLELVRIGTESARVEQAHDRPVFRLRGELLPVVHLGRLLEPRTPIEDAGTNHHLLVLSADGRRFGLVVDRVRDTEEIVVKALPSGLREGGLFAGATVRGDGRVALILDVTSLAAAAGVDRLNTRLDAEPAAAPRVESERTTVLLVRSHDGESAAVRVGEVDRIVEFEAEAFQHLGRRPAVAFEGDVLPIAMLAAGAPGEQLAAIVPGRSWPVLVHTTTGGRRGFLVDSVVDIAELEGSPSSGRLLVRESITELISLPDAAARSFSEAA